MAAHNKSQVSFEFLLVVALIFLLMVPAFAVFFSFIGSSAKEVLDFQMQSLGKSLVSNADKAYYYGMNSKITVKIKFPENIEEIRSEMRIMQGFTFHALIITFMDSGEAKEKIFQTAYPISVMLEKKDYSAGERDIVLENPGGKTVLLGKA